MKVESATEIFIILVLSEDGDPSFLSEDGDPPFLSEDGEPPFLSEDGDPSFLIGDFNIPTMHRLSKTLMFHQRLQISCRRGKKTHKKDED